MLSVYKVIMKVTSFSTFHAVKFRDTKTNKLVTDFLVLPVDIRYNYLPFLSTY
jgi:hypothetical protein